MRQIVIVALGWTAVVLAVLLLWPGGVQTPGCMRAVNASADCLAQAALANDRVWWTQTLPMLVLFASGYVVVGAFAHRLLRRTRRGGDRAGADGQSSRLGPPA